MPESTWMDYEILEELELPPWILSPAERRRLKAAIVLILVWTLVSLIHLFPVLRWGVVGLALLLSLHVSRLITAEPMSLGAESENKARDQSETGLKFLNPAAFPKVSILIPAKNESAVLPHLLESLANLDYPCESLEIWVVDDGSTDHTLAILEAAVATLPMLHIHKRLPGAGGGKSGALNEVIPLTTGHIILVCDADAQVPPNFLQQTLPLFFTPLSPERPVGAVQTRKAISNRSTNFWTRNQQAEMILDSYWQQQRTLAHGIGELRGNGQLVRRDVLLKCGGWNEGSLTDDLDLTFKLHLAGVDIAFLADPPIQEEGVLSWKGLWHQRCRWAEGGYQRYLDYWPGIVKNTMGRAKTIDLLSSFIILYLMPIGLIPDFGWMMFYSHYSVLTPLAVVIMGVWVIGLIIGLQQVEALRGWQLVRRSLMAMLYMSHWIPVMVVTTVRMCVQPKKLKWVKTVHQGQPVT